MRLLLTLFIYVSSLNLIAQDLTFEETVEYINQRVGYWQGESRGYVVKNCSFSLKENCNFIYTKRYYKKGGDEEYGTKVVLFDLSTLIETKDDDDWEYILFKFSDDINISTEWKTIPEEESHDLERFRLKCRGQDVERLIKAFNHLKSLCPSDPFDE